MYFISNITGLLCSIDNVSILENQKQLKFSDCQSTVTQNHRTDSTVSVQLSLPGPGDQYCALQLHCVSVSDTLQVTGHWWTLPLCLYPVTPPQHCQCICVLLKFILAVITITREGVLCQVLPLALVRVKQPNQI